MLGARRAERLADLAGELGDAATVVPMDVRDAAGSGHLVAAALERYGKLDVLVANAGIGVYGGILDATDEDTRRTTIYTGKTSRATYNRFHDLWEESGLEPLRFPQQVLLASADAPFLTHDLAAALAGAAGKISRPYSF